MKIAQYRVEELLKKVKTFNNKAKKLGLPEVKAELVGTELVEFSYKDDEGNKVPYFIEFSEYTITGEIPRVGGWAIHSKVEHSEVPGQNFVYTNAGFESVASLRTTEFICQHCDKIRGRASVYLLQNLESGEQKLVGKSCLKDFLPETNILEVLAYLENLHKLSDGAGLCDEDGDPIDNGNAPRSAWVYPVWDLIAESLIVIRKWGFTSKKKAQEQFESGESDVPPEVAATATLLGNTNPKARKELYSDEEVSEIAKSGKVEACLEWIKEQDAKSDFFYNLQLAVKQTAAPTKLYAFVAAGVSLFLRATEEKVAKQNTNKLNEFVGTVGERRVFADVKIVREYVSEGTFGSTFITTLEMVDGQCLVWFASKRVGEVGEQLSVKATIKEHKLYNDLKQTVITRGSKI
jgi:hypothetical protein